jgi:hypothetical protein
LVEGIDPQPVKQLATRDVIRFLRALGFLLPDLFQRLIQSLPDEKIGLSIKTTVLLVDQIDNLGKFEVLHEWNKRSLSTRLPPPQPPERMPDYSLMQSYFCYYPMILQNPDNSKLAFSAETLHQDK